MICDAIIPKQSASWVEDRPFLLWEIGPRRILDHWMDTLFRSNATLRLWMEIPDERLMAFVRETFPLNLRIQAGAGPPTSRPEACTFLDSKGSIIIRRGPQLTPYLPKQPASHTWFAMVRKWLAELQETGSQTPEVERHVAPGVFVGHHCDISKDTQLIAPCWVGSGSTIRGATVGPQAVIGENCIISHGCRIEDSYVVGTTYVKPYTQMVSLAMGRTGAISHATGTDPASPPMVQH